MAFRKLQFKNVQDTRSSQVIGEGELAIDPVTNQLYLGDGSTSGGVAVGASRTLDVETVSTALSSSSGSPTALSDTECILLTHVDGTIRYASISDATTTGTVRYIKVTGAGGSSRNITGTGLSVNLQTADVDGVTLMWTGSAWIVLSQTNL